MNDEDLLAEIRERPDDDEPRLIYADWLEERGDPRADLIRVQCALATTRNPEERSTLRGRERKLLAEYRDAWFGPLRALGASEIRFRRGFVESLRIVGGTLHRFEDIAAQAPLLDDLRVRSASRALPFGFDASAFRQLRSLTMRVGGVDAGAIESIADAENLGGLRHLDLSGNALGSDGLGVLSESEFLTCLESLGLRANGSNAAGAHALVESPILDSVTELEMDVNRLGSGAAAFLELAEPDRIERLDLSHCLVPEPIGRDLRAVFGERVHLTDDRRWIGRDQFEDEE